MTPRQTQRLKAKIAGIKKTLAAERRKFGGYDDSRGLRYLPLTYYLQLEDYRGGLAYTRWFDKNFPDDTGFADFLFAWTVILYKNGQTPQARSKALQTFCCEPQVFDHFYGRPLIVTGLDAAKETPVPFSAGSFPYNAGQPELADFAAWLHQQLSGEDFRDFHEQFSTLQAQLANETNLKRRRDLLLQLDRLEQQARGSKPGKKI